MNEEIRLSDDFYYKLKNILKDEQILKDEPLKLHTTFKIGGPAKFLLLPESVTQIVECVKLCKAEKVPFYVMGNGSNLLVSDKGYLGVMIKLGDNFSDISIQDYETFNEDGTRVLKYLVKASSGVLLSSLSKYVAKEGLTGFEFAEGIPGTLGGAVAMNAGAYDGEIKHAIVSSTVLDEEGNVLVLDKEQLQLGYRKSIVQKNHYIVLDATFSFEKGDEDKISSRMQELKEKRAEKQPLEYPSAGSTFKRPVGYFAGKLIMDSGLRGYQVGKAMVSIKHCGFVINTGDATAVEVYTLINHIKDTVFKNYGVVLEPEVKLLGNFEPSSNV